jgi:hypothetical protein
LTDEQEANGLVATLRKSARQSQKEHARSTRDFNERETKRVSGRSTRSRRDNTRQNDSVKGDILKTGGRTSYQPVVHDGKANRGSLNPDNLRD